MEQGQNLLSYIMYPVRIPNYSNKEFKRHKRDFRFKITFFVWPKILSWTFVSAFDYIYKYIRQKEKKYMFHRLVQRERGFFCCPRVLYLIKNYSISNDCFCQTKISFTFFIIILFSFLTTRKRVTILVLNIF